MAVDGGEFIGGQDIGEAEDHVLDQINQLVTGKYFSRALARRRAALGRRLGPGWVRPTPGGGVVAHPQPSSFATLVHISTGLALMKHRIDPRIDCVFKALLGAEENRNLLLHFLNAMLGEELQSLLSEVDILNPYNEKEFLDDKLSIVDVKARDGEGRIYQIEVQLLYYRHLPARILYGWADLYSEQLKSGDEYAELQPTYTIWLLAEALLKADPDYRHIYKLRDEKGRVLLEHGGVWLLELGKFHADSIDTEQERWLKFFQAGEQLDEAALPVWMNTTEMRQAMSTLKRFSDKERDYHAYQARQNFLRQQRTMERELEEERAEKLEALQREEAALREKEAALREKEAALREIARLKARWVSRRPEAESSLLKTRQGLEEPIKEAVGFHQPACCRDAVSAWGFTRSCPGRWWQ
ncbi:MAG: Rpn family recombination-promoting nuclease/putative transposase [Gammaproteobacteria bacterium]